MTDITNKMFLNSPLLGVVAARVFADSILALRFNNYVLQRDGELTCQGQTVFYVCEPCHGQTEGESSRRVAAGTRLLSI